MVKKLDLLLAICKANCEKCGNEEFLFVPISDDNGLLCEGCMNELGLEIDTEQTRKELGGLYPTSYKGVEMADNEQELLSDDERKGVINSVFEKHKHHYDFATIEKGVALRHFINHHWGLVYEALLKAQVAKLKAMGYVKWDREKVTKVLDLLLMTQRASIKVVDTIPFADQLKEILTGRI